MDPVVHFEITADNVERASAFYSNVFGWETSKMPGMDYTFVSSVKTDDEGNFDRSGAINGGMFKREEPFKNPVIVMDVHSIEDSVKKIKENGGKVIIPKQPVADMGFTCYFEDSEGNLLGMWESATKS